MHIRLIGSKISKYCLMLKMETIENFDFNELKIASKEIKEYKYKEEMLIFYSTDKIKKRREFSLEYKGGKLMFRADGRLYHLIYSHIFPEEVEDTISLFMVKLNETLNFLFKDIMDEYDKVNEARYVTGIGFSCEANRIWAYDLGIPFTGSCGFEIDKVTCWVNEKYSNLF